MNLSEHFTDKEFTCPCGCGQWKAAPTLIARLEALRAIVGPVRITSGYRCPKHNAAVGGAPNSEHMQGIAADVAANVPYADLVAACTQVFRDGGVGTYPPKTDGHVHVDVGPARRWQQ